MAKGVKVAVVSFKGGVGKSTISDMLKNALENSVNLNIDISQDAEKINSGETINLSEVFENDYTFEEIQDGGKTAATVETLSEVYDYVIIDTPGEQTNELIEVLSNSITINDFIVVPTTPGERSLNTTYTTLETLDGVELLKKGQKIIFVINQYEDDSDVEIEKKTITNFMEKSFGKKYDFYFTKLKYSKAVKTMEGTKKSIHDLKAKNILAYRKFEQRVAAMIQDVEKIMGVKNVTR